MIAVAGFKKATKCDRRHRFCPSGSWTAIGAASHPAVASTETGALKAPDAERRVFNYCLQLLLDLEFRVV
jgi:hypothetical protein